MIKKNALPNILTDFKWFKYWPPQDFRPDESEADFLGANSVEEVEGLWLGAQN